EAVVLLTSESNQTANLIYDDVQFTTAVAFLNPSDQPVTVSIVAYSAVGAQIGSTQVVLGPHQKQSSILKTFANLGAMAGNRGWATFSVQNGAISVLA